MRSYGRDALYLEVHLYFITLKINSKNQGTISFVPLVQSENLKFIKQLFKNILASILLGVSNKCRKYILT